jgi:RNA methyltransferase, TrmH family
MLTTAQIKHLKSLKLKKYRQNYDEFIIEGDKLITEALLGNEDMTLLIATDEWIVNNKATLPAHVAVEIAKQKELDTISSLSTAPPVMALVKQRSYTIADIEVSDNWILALDGISDPGNLGTIIRSADWFGINTIICSNNCVELYNPKVVQSTMGSIFHVKTIYTDLHAFIAANKHICVAATLDGQQVYGFQFDNEGILVIGSESHGISASILSLIQHRITIPSFGKAESLNAGVATSILLSLLANK